MTPTTNIKLADFTNGWHRHKDDDKIVFVDHRDIFLAAVNDASCRSVIWEQPAEKIAEDRAALTKAWDALKMDGQDTFGPELHDLIYFRQNEETKYNIKPKHGRPQMLEMAKLFCASLNLNNARVRLLPNFRQPESEAREHDPHGFEVLNRVFFSAGTRLQMNFGTFQVAEGDYLYMKPFVQHYPDFKTDNNADTPRLTMVTF